MNSKTDATICPSRYKCSISPGLAYKSDIAMLAQMLHTGPATRVYTRAMELQEAVEHIVKPRFLIKELPVGKDGSGRTLVNNIAIDSHIVPGRIGDARSLMAYIISCGPEIAAYMSGVKNALDHYILDQIAYVGYLQAKAAMLEHAANVWGIEHYNLLSPGSIIDWPAAEVKSIFAMLDGDHQKLNIRLLESGFIDPPKSAAGLLVINDEEFHSCDICDRPDCPDRVSPYDGEKLAVMSGE